MNLATLLLPRQQAQCPHSNGNQGAIINTCSQHCMCSCLTQFVPAIAVGLVGILWLANPESRHRGKWWEGGVHGDSSLIQEVIHV